MPRLAPLVLRTIRAAALLAMVLILALAALILALATPLPAVAESAGSAADARTNVGGAVDLAALGWVWPAERFRLERAYVRPAHQYGPGHRGIDLALPAAAAVRSPAGGIVAFAGSVAGRGILTIDHGDGLVTTLEPVDSALAPGMAVGRGENVATLASGGHATAGSLHFGVRLHGEYINPLLLLGGVPRAVLLPCCE